MKDHDWKIFQKLQRFWFFIFMANTKHDYRFLCMRASLVVKFKTVGKTKKKIDKSLIDLRLVLLCFSACWSLVEANRYLISQAKRLSCL